MPITGAVTPFGLKPGICTSSTRPASPYVGQAIYETDTDRLLFYYGATSGWRPPWNQAWGTVPATAGGEGGWGKVSSGTNQGSIVGTLVDLTNFTISFDALLNRLYMVQWFGAFTTTVAGDAVNVVLEVGGVGTFQSTIVAMPAASTNYGASIGYIGNASPGSTLWKIRAQRITGSGTLTMSASASKLSTMAIIDMGPYGSAPSS